MSYVDKFKEVIRTAPPKKWAPKLDIHVASVQPVG